MRYLDRLAEHSPAIDALRAVGRVRWAFSAMISRQVEEQEGISLDWFEVLVAITETPDNVIKMSDLASLTLHSKSGLTRLLDRMEGAGLVRRETSPEDRRVVFATLTDEGNALLERVAAPVVEILIERFASHLTAEEGQLITEVLNRVLEANGLEPEPSIKERVAGTRDAAAS